MNLEGQSVFKKVAVSEKKSLLRKLAEMQGQLAIRGEDESFFHLQAMQNERDELLLCHHTQNSKAHEKAQGIIANFMIDEERYFLRCNLSFARGWAILDLTGDLFLLQRRANARIDLPEQFTAYFNITSVEGRSVFIDAKILDMSAGGLKLEWMGDLPALSPLAKMKGMLKLGSRRPWELTVEVRHHVKKSVNNITYQTAGVKFYEVDSFTENRLLSLMMDLQRELYLKYPNKKD
jgi:PilZ domain.